VKRGPNRFGLTSGLVGLFGLAALALANCTTDGLPGGGASTVSAAPNSPDAPAYASAGPATQVTQPSEAPTPANVDYKISPRDIIDISVFQVPDLNKTVQVSEDGSIALPLVGKVQVSGETTQDAEKLLAGKLRAKYLQSPQVSIFVKQFGQRVTISGEVKTPKVLATDGSTTLTQALANAGGLSELADSSRIHVATTKGGRVTDKVYSLTAIQAGQELDPTLRGGDLVVAEQSGTRVAFKTLKDMVPFAILGSVL